MNRRTRVGLSGIAGLALVFSWGASARGDSEAGEGTQPPPVSLDRLLRLPSGLKYEVEERGGYTKREWRERFTKAIGERDQAQKELDESQEELARIAANTSSWNVGTPGTSGGQVDPDAPLSFELNQRIRRQKRDLAEAEAELENLQVEANLAHVPEEWRVPPENSTERSAAVEDW